MHTLTQLVDIESSRIGDKCAHYGDHTLGMLLYAIASASRCKHIVEIGYCCGYSACMLCAGAVEGQNGSTTGLCVVSVDIDPCDQGAAVKKQPFGHIHEFVLGDSKQVTDQVASKMNGHIDLLFLDGDHSHDGCLADWCAYKDMLTDTGIVLFHDTYLESIHQVIQCIEGWNFVNLNGWASLTIGSRHRFPNDLQIPSPSSIQSDHDGLAHDR